MEGCLSIRHLFALLTRVFVSVMRAGITYFVWMGPFLVLRDSIGSLVAGKRNLLGCSARCHSNSGLCAAG
jgi:hypothetical protein